jgi:hypothetical protein
MTILGEMNDESWPSMTNVSSMVAGNTRLLNGATPVPTLGLF